MRVKEEHMDCPLSCDEKKVIAQQLILKNINNIFLVGNNIKVQNE